MSDKWKIKARLTRGGWRAVAFSKRGRVAFKTVPVFRSPDDAVQALRAELKGDFLRHTRSSSRTSHGSRRITHDERKYIASKWFALPERRALPLSNPEGTRLDPKHVANAAARLSMMRRQGHVTPSEWRRAATRIMRAACEVGVRKTCERHLGVRSR